MNLHQFPDPLSPAPSISTAMNTPDNKEEDPADQEPTDGDIQIEYSSGYLQSQNKKALKINCL
jgi:hypothetical protein